ncbi:hypothetical protein C3L33_14589, partial [Rhododendron williamsianum]
MASTACFMIVSRNDIPIYEAEVGTAVKLIITLVDFLSWNKLRRPIYACARVSVSDSLLNKYVLPHEEKAPLCGRTSGVLPTGVTGVRMKILIETFVDGLLTSLGVGSIQTPFLKIFFMLGQLGLFISLEIDFSSSGCSVLALGTGMKDAAHQHQFILHAALDIVQDLAWTTSAMFLKAIDRFNELAVSVYVTAVLHTRLMLLHDSRNDDGIKSFFQEVHELYIKVGCISSFLYSNFSVAIYLLHPKASQSFIK